jgi:hypothetical protein
MNSDERYGRRHPIASICNSDGKQLTPSATDATNFIGFRHTWLKMSAITIEGLRQACIDHFPWASVESPTSGWARGPGRRFRFTEGRGGCSRRRFTRTRKLEADACGVNWGQCHAHAAGGSARCTGMEKMDLSSTLGARP